VYVIRAREGPPWCDEDVIQPVIVGELVRFLDHLEIGQPWSARQEISDQVCLMQYRQQWKEPSAKGLHLEGDLHVPYAHKVNVDLELRRRVRRDVVDYYVEHV